MKLNYQKNLLKDFDKDNHLNKKNIEDLNNYGEKILNSTTTEILELGK